MSGNGATATLGAPADAGRQAARRADPGDRSRVLFVSYTAERTGPVNSLLLLLDHLGERWEAGVLLPGRGPLTEELERRGIPAYSLPAITKGHLFDIVRLLRRHRFDLVYANTSDGTCRLTFAAAKLAGCAYACHVRALEWHKGRLALGHLRFADAVIAVSRSCAASVERFVRPGRLHVVYNGVPSEPEDGEGPPPEREARRDDAESPGRLRAEVGAAEGEPLFLSVAHICPRKGQEQAIAAFAAADEKLGGGHLCLVGALDRYPDYVRRQREAIEREGLGDRVHVLGFRPDVPPLLAEADVFVHTALADPHPRAVLEAMRAGLPVVAFAVDGVAETVVDGETGRLVPSGDVAALAEAMAALATDPRERRRLGAAARDAVRERFTASATARGVEMVLRDALGPRSGRRPVVR